MTELPYRRKEPLNVQVEWAPGGQEFFFDLLASIPIRCGNCAERFVDKNGESLCPNCGEEPTWDPPTCGACTPLEEAGVILPDCPVCDSLCQDYESNKLSDAESGP